MLKTKKPWWSETFSRDYLTAMNLEFSSDLTKSEVDFFVKIGKITKKDRILDVACADGRHTIEFSKQGYNVTGLDFSKQYLALARKKIRLDNLNATLIEADMRQPPQHKKYDVILILRSSFGYFSNKQNRQVLAQMYQLLNPGGRLIIDVYNKSLLLSQIKKNGHFDKSKNQYLWLRQETKKDQITYYDTDTYTPGKNLVHFQKKWQVNKKIHHYEYFINHYSPIQYIKMLKKIGFSFTSFYGAYSPKFRWHNKSWRTIVVAFKPPVSLITQIQKFFYGQRI